MNLNSIARAVFLLVCCLASVGVAQTEAENANAEPETQTEKSFYTVDHYDSEADPAEQLVATLKRAKAENKTVLLQVGGDWCGWCKLMTNFIAETDLVSGLMKEHFLIQKVTYDSENSNEEFLGDYPKISGYPHIFVLNADGKMLHSQNTEELEEGKGYSEEAFTEFLNKWKPSDETSDDDE
jgi:thiol:disulfide interchange protein